MLGASLGLLLSLSPRAAEACGGFFCSATNGVNQSAERIVFAHNGDGTVTAVIEIQYDGPAASFSWLLPISSVPMGDDIAVSSNFAFQRLQQATNPQYNLQTKVEGVCDQRDVDSRGGPTGAEGVALSPNASGDPSDHGVTVEAQGLVGSFEWTVISVDPALPRPADAAVNWLTENQYDVPQGAPGLLGPYLQDGLYLLALKLQKGASVGSIRPIVLTYAAERPMIPIKLTAVAANDDMGVMAWVLGDAQAVPQNYNALQLNDARINWFNANGSYNQVVTEAADDAGGQGFVTELAGATSTFGSAVWGPNDEASWEAVRERVLQDTTNAYQDLVQYAGFDGFWELVGPKLTLSQGMTLEQLKSCPFCYSGGISVDQALLDELELKVIQPVRLVQELIDAHPQMTRLYTTLSAAEMTVDPLFTFNADLAPVSNVHSATRVIECAPGYYQEEAPWRIELPSGGVIRGEPSTAGTWPDALGAQPANERIVRQGESGTGKVLDDNSDEIAVSLDDYNASVPRPAPRSSDGGSCSVSSQRSTSSSSLGLALLGLGALWRRRRVARGRPLK